MSLRTKLLCLLLALSVLPVLGLRLRGQRVVEDVGRTLADRSSQLILEKAQAQVLAQAQAQAGLLRREGELLEQTVRLQALEMEHALAQPGLDAVERAHRNAGRGLGDILAGQATVLVDGRAVPPAISNPTLADWFEPARDAREPVWTLPRPDPTIGRIPLTVSCAVRDAFGRFAGVTAVRAAMDLKNRRGGLAVVSPLVSVYLVYPETAPDKTVGLLLLGREEAVSPADNAGPAEGENALSSGELPGDAPAGAPPPQTAARSADTASPSGETAQTERAESSEGDWFGLDAAEAQAKLLDAIKTHVAGSFETAYRGRSCLVAYAPVGVRDAALVFVLPMREITAEAVAARTFIEHTVADQIAATRYIVALTMAAVALAAWLVSRGVARPILQLDRAARRVASGDLDVKVHPGGGGEIEALGRAFNHMIPQLRERVRLSQAMLLARQVQSGLLPARLPQPPGLDVAGVSLPCDETGGDYFDAVENARTLQGVTALVVGDVSGHGVDAALYMTTARAYLRLRARQPGDPAQVVGEVNRFLVDDTHGSGRFMTLFYLEVDAGGLRFVRAGHDPALVYDPAADDFEELSGRGAPLGVIPDFAFECVPHPALSPGQVLLVGSDGLWEARNPAGEMFGKERVRETLRLHAHLGARALVDALLGAQEVFREGRPPQDDVTLVVVKAVGETRRKDATG